MKLSLAEFRAMNNPIRQALQREYEFPIFRSLGLAHQPGEVLEIGCGSGYGAILLASLHPLSYVGIDLMPEQIALAQKRSMAEAQFLVVDATNLSFLPDYQHSNPIRVLLKHKIAWHRLQPPPGRNAGGNEEHDSIE